MCQGCAKSRPIAFTAAEEEHEEKGVDRRQQKEDEHSGWKLETVAARQMDVENRIDQQTDGEAQPVGYGENEVNDDVSVKREKREVEIRVISGDLESHPRGEHENDPCELQPRRPRRWGKKRSASAQGRANPAEWEVEFGPSRLRLIEMRHSPRACYELSPASVPTARPPTNIHYSRPPPRPLPGRNLAF